MKTPAAKAKPKPAAPVGGGHLAAAKPAPAKPNGTGAAPAAQSRRQVFESRVIEDLASPPLSSFIRSVPAPRARKDQMKLRMATIASASFNRSLSTAVECEKLRPKDWRQQLEQSRPTILICESSWDYLAPKWRDIIVDPSHVSRNLSEEFTELLQHCRANGIRTVFVFTVNEEHFPAFTQTASQFERVYASTATDVKKLLSFGITAGVLPPAIAPSLTNPLRRDMNGHLEITRDFGILCDSFYDILYNSGKGEEALSAIVEPALDYLFWISESKYKIRNNNARLNRELRRRFIGCFEDKERAFLLKYSKIFFALTPSEQPLLISSMRSLMESMASKSAVMTNFHSQLPPELAPLAVAVNDRDDSRQSLARLSTDHELRRRMTHLAYREVMTNHTYDVRIRQIASDLGLDIPEPEQPLVSVVVPTMRPELVPFALECYRSQDYENKELIIVVNRDGCMPSDIYPMLRESDNARVLKVPNEQAIGACMNVGIGHSNGQYWAKMDDDDYYGPRYLSDTMLNRNFTDFDIVGKSQHFVYIEDYDKLYLHKKDWAAHSLNHFVAGGTFVVRKTPDPEMMFDEKVRGYADIDFLLRNLDNGRTVVSGDPFNFILIRRADKTSHTWTIDSSEIALSAPICEGFGLDRVSI
ncbi:glycosyltransferase [Jiella mangrovi]|uniref:Glycosyltransferase n=1 Tax=Jiella mangrovi TaxID=2821407 RepID=A0ABS4BIT4_9HYPH|nr:glycosyltransferase [Jiella mangrovi]MBP0616674.1 glycosyltransferase [Jiella mangrovi]